MALLEDILDSLSIKKTDLVLEVGGGCMPFWRADLQCDNDILESRERAGPISNRAPLVCGDITSLPFRNKSFDFVICSQVLEHVSDPVVACSELSRVGKMGYVEMPSYARELFFGWPFHKWIVKKDGDVLVFSPNLLPQPFGLEFHRLQETCPEFHEFIRTRHDIMNVTCRWEGELKCRVDRFPGKRFSPIESVEMGADRKWVRAADVESLERMIPVESGGLSGLCRKVGAKAQRFFKKRYRSRITGQILRSILCSPCCRQDLFEGNDVLRCAGCGKVYPVRNGIPDFVHPL